MRNIFKIAIIGTPILLCCMPRLIKVGHLKVEWQQISNVELIVRGIKGVDEGMKHEILFDSAIVKLDSGFAHKIEIGIDSFREIQNMQVPFIGDYLNDDSEIFFSNNNNKEIASACFKSQDYNICYFYIRSEDGTRYEKIYKVYLDEVLSKEICDTVIAYRNGLQFNRESFQ